VYFLLFSEVSVTGTSSTYEGGIIAITAVAPVVSDQLGTFNNITFTINGAPINEAAGGLNINPITLGMKNALLVINNTPVSLSGQTVNCIAELNNGLPASCTPVTLLVQGKYPIL